MPPFPISRILVLGASGQFGRRLCRRLVQLGGFSLLLGGRDEQRLKVARRQLCALKPDARIDTFTCDVAVPGLPDLLRAQKINLVIHLARPFQGQDHTVAEACLEAEAALHRPGGRPRLRREVFNTRRYRAGKRNPAGHWGEHLAGVFISNRRRNA